MCVCFKENTPSVSSPGLRWKEGIEFGRALDFLLSVRLLVQSEGGDTGLDLGDLLILKGPVLSNFMQSSVPTAETQLAFGNVLNWGKNLSLQ